MKIFLLGIAILILFTPHSHAQEMINEETTSPAGTMTAEMKKIDYNLAYPGILPDHPLYFIKALRDRVVSSLITDPLKKSEFSLLQADKRLGAGASLVDKNKDELAVTTISKGANYFDSAVSNIRAAHQQKSDIKPLLERLLASSQKHTVVLEDLEKKIDKRYQKGIQHEKERILQYKKDIENIQKSLN